MGVWEGGGGLRITSEKWFYTNFFMLPKFCVIFFAAVTIKGLRAICWYSCFYSFLFHPRLPSKKKHKPLHYTRKKGRKVFRRVYLSGWQFLEHYKKIYIKYKYIKNLQKIYKWFGKGKSEIENIYNFMCVVCFSSIIIWNQHPQLKIIKTAKKYFYDLIFKAAKITKNCMLETTATRIKNTS